MSMSPKEIFYTMKKKHVSFMILERLDDMWERLVSHCGCCIMTIVYTLYFSGYGFIK